MVSRNQYFMKKKKIRFARSAEVKKITTNQTKIPQGKGLKKVMKTWYSVPIFYVFYVLLSILYSWTFEGDRQNLPCRLSSLPEEVYHHAMVHSHNPQRDPQHCVFSYCRNHGFQQNKSLPDRCDKFKPRSSHVCEKCLWGITEHFTQSKLLSLLHYKKDFHNCHTLWHLWIWIFPTHKS